jgi:hypothetical protein
VRALLVEVADVDAENVLELAAPEDQQPVETLPAHAADPAFRVGIGVWRLDRVGCVNSVRRSIFAICREIGIVDREACEGVIGAGGAT